jgi:hypothetical protein
MGDDNQHILHSGLERGRMSESITGGCAQGVRLLGEGAGVLSGEVVCAGGGLALEACSSGAARSSGEGTACALRAEQYVVAGSTRSNPSLAFDGERRGNSPPIEELIARRDAWWANNGLSKCPWDSAPARRRVDHLKLNQKGRSEIRRRVEEDVARGTRGLLRIGSLRNRELVKRSQSNALCSVLHKKFRSSAMFPILRLMLARPKFWMLLALNWNIH